MAGVLSALSASDTVDWHSMQPPWMSPPLRWLSGLRCQCSGGAAEVSSGQVTIDFFYCDSAIEGRREIGLLLTSTGTGEEIILGIVCLVVFFVLSDGHCNLLVCLLCEC